MVAFTWTGAVNNDFSNAGNWTPTGGPPNASSNVTIGSGSTINLSGNVQVETLSVSGAVTLNGGSHTLEVTNFSGVHLASGTTLNIPDLTLNADNPIVLDGTGNYSIVGNFNTVVGAHGETIGAGQSLTLSNMTYNVDSVISGAGTLHLAGATLYSPNVAPTVAIVLDTVPTGNAFNTLVVPQYSTNLNIQNLGYGTIINAGGSNLSLVGAGPTYNLVSDAPGNPTLGTVTLASNVTPDQFTNSGGNFYYLCFCKGTRILTEGGEVAVEDLKVGDLAITASGKARPIRWLGRMILRVAANHKIEDISPVRIARDAFGEGLPVRDLYLSPGHCVAWNGVMIPVDVLKNGRTVAQELRESVEYWHVELDEHDVLLAEGLPCESYLNTGGAISFVNGLEFREISSKPRHWSETCLPYTASGPTVEKTKAELLDRAQKLRHSLTSDPDLHIVADGRRVEAIPLGQKRLLFVLPAGQKSVSLHSRTFAPADTDPASGDRRMLGACIMRMQIDGDDLPLDAVADGWHELEQSGAIKWRWTDGRTPLPANARAIILDLGGRGCYWVEPEAWPLAVVA